MTAIPTTIGAAGEAFLARLAAVIAGYAIEPYPDDPKNYRLTHQRGAFLLCYRGADHTESELSEAATARNMRWDVNVLAKSLAGADGVYAMLELARAALAGFKASGFTPCVIRTERFIAHAEGVWIYALTFAATTVSMPIDADTVIGALVTQLRAVSPYSTTQVP